MENLLLSKKETARILSLSVRTVEYIIARKDLEAIRVGRRVLVSAKSLKAFARKNHPGPFGEGGSRK